MLTNSFGRWYGEMCLASSIDDNTVYSFSYILPPAECRVLGQQLTSALIQHTIHLSIRSYFRFVFVLLRSSFTENLFLNINYPNIGIDIECGEHGVNRYQKKKKFMSPFPSTHRHTHTHTAILYTMCKHNAFGLMYSVHVDVTYLYSLTIASIG